MDSNVVPLRPVVQEEKVGFRAWYVEDDSVLWPPNLASVVHHETWPWNDWLHAECRYGCTEVPNEKCTCGIYAAMDRRHLLGLGYNGLRHRGRTTVIGQVGLAGKVIPGTQGWIGQKARVIQLWVPYEDWKLVSPLREAYHVPVRLTNVYSLRG